MSASVDEKCPRCGELPTVDIEAIAWAYEKLMAFGVQNGKMESAMMMDRLQATLVTRCAGHLEHENAELVKALKEIGNIALSHPYAGVTCGEIARAAIAKVTGAA